MISRFVFVTQYDSRNSTSDSWLKVSMKLLRTVRLNAGVCSFRRARHWSSVLQKTHFRTYLNKILSEPKPRQYTVRAKPRYQYIVFAAFCYVCVTLENNLLRGYEWNKKKAAAHLDSVSVRAKNHRLHADPYTKESVFGIFCAPFDELCGERWNYVHTKCNVRSWLRPKFRSRLAKQIRFRTKSQWQPRETKIWSKSRHLVVISISNSV